MIEITQDILYKIRSNSYSKLDYCPFEFTTFLIINSSFDDKKECYNNCYYYLTNNKIKFNLYSNSSPRGNLGPMFMIIEDILFGFCLFWHVHQDILKNVKLIEKEDLIPTINNLKKYKLIL